MLSNLYFPTGSNGLCRPNKAIYMTPISLKGKKFPPRKVYVLQYSEENIISLLVKKIPGSFSVLKNTQ